jgi:MFS family permease
MLIAIRFLLNKHLNQWNKKKVIFSALIICCLALLSAGLLEHFPSMIILIAIGLLYGLAHGLLYPTMNVLYVEQTPSQTGKATLIFILLYSLGGTFSSFVYGFIADHFGYANMYFIAFSFTLIVTCFYFWKNIARHMNKIKNRLGF